VVLCPVPDINYKHTQAVSDQPKSGLHEHKIIQAAINNGFFKSCLDIVVQFNNLFCLFPCVALMLVFTAIGCMSDLEVQMQLLRLCDQIEHTINQWTTGT
jgi:hypothetical protein